MDYIHSCTNDLLVSSFNRFEDKNPSQIGHFLFPKMQEFMV
jgi:hypothetical protein